jgi:hypothetical protein
VPYFPVQRTTAPDEWPHEDFTAYYRIDRAPRPSDGQLYGGGLGIASVLDVRAHPIRAAIRQINVVPLLAVTVVGCVAVLMLAAIGLRP